MKSLFITNPYLFCVSDTHFITFGELTYSLVVFQNLPILCPACGCLVRRNHPHLHYLEHLFLCPHIAHKAETKQVHNLRHIIDSLYRLLNIACIKCNTRISILLPYMNHSKSEILELQLLPLINVMWKTIKNGYF